MVAEQPTAIFACNWARIRVLAAALHPQAGVWACLGPNISPDTDGSVKVGALPSNFTGTALMLAADTDCQQHAANCTTPGCAFGPIAYPPSLCTHSCPHVWVRWCSTLACNLCRYKELGTSQSQVSAASQLLLACPPPLLPPGAPAWCTRGPT